MTDRNKDRETPGADGTVRKAHYGEGRQPWDDIVELGWAPQFAAGSILKYLRRNKDEEHSLESARWYMLRLHEMPNSGLPYQDVAKEVWTALIKTLTNEEYYRLFG